jgi:hypothetical protein
MYTNTVAIASPSCWVNCYSALIKGAAILYWMSQEPSHLQDCKIDCFLGFLRRFTDQVNCGTVLDVSGGAFTFVELQDWVSCFSQKQ